MVKLGFLHYVCITWYLSFVLIHCKLNLFNFFFIQLNIGFVPQRMNEVLILAAANEENSLLASRRSRVDQMSSRRWPGGSTFLPGQGIEMSCRNGSNIPSFKLKSMCKRL